MSRKCSEVFPDRPAGGPAPTTENERTETTVSSEKKAQTRAERSEKRRQEEQKDRRSMMIYTVVAVVVAAAAVVMLLFNSGILHRGLTALDINGTKYSAVDVQYYYSSIYSEQANQYLFNTAQPVKKQIYDETTGQSWYDHLMDLAVERLTRNTALSQLAKSEGYTLSADAQADMDSFLAQLNTAWINYNMSSRDAFIRANFGSGMTYDRLVELINMEYLASDYAQSRLDAIDHPEADYDAYYQEHADQLDTVTYSQFTFQAQVPAADADGNAVEMTDEERAAALEELKSAQKALAGEVQAKLEGGSDPEDVAGEYGDQLYSSSLSSRSTGSSLSLYASYADWLLDSGRRAGDVTVAEYDSGSAYYYYVIRFEGRELDQEETHTVRHLLVRAGDTSTADPTQEQYDEAEQKAREFWDQWKAGDADEDSFAALVSANTDDTSSASTGGLISNITSTSGYVEAFRDWATDPARKEGDVDLVKTEYGWHLMYYVSTDDPVWRQSTASALQNQDYEALADGASQGWSVSRGLGMKLIRA